jgi:eukaryotic-like serine/threonine-protein kinase
MSIEIGQRVGDYQILNEIGSGGMGRVYRVRNVLSDRIEAMKILLPDVASRQELAARFLREIKLLASLDHPNIAALRTALTVDNQLVMIMEYVEGTTLADRLSQGPIPVPDTLSYIDQVLNALSYAHQKHVIHRDIKPANIILTPQGVIKLMDFGIARSGDERSLTMTGTTLGSLSYMSPEQVKGEATDARSDIYSAGISLYELVTGQRPFQAHSDYAIMAAHVKEAPKPPIELAHELPPALNEIILMAIAKDPAQRFQTADAFRNALSSVRAASSAAQAAPSAPAPVPDAGVTATLAVPAAAATSVAAAPVQTPSAAKVAPGPTPPVVPVTPPAHPSTHRGLYMTLGALVVLAVLFAAAIYVPRRSKTQATTSPTSSSQPQSAGAAQSTSIGSQTGTEQAPPAAAVPDSAGSTATPPPAAESRTTTPASSMPSQPQPAKPRPVDSRRASGKKAGSGPVVNATLQEPETGAQPQSATGGPADSAANRAALDELTQEVDQLSSRAAAVDASLDRLQQQQNSAGYGLRGDIVARRASMQTRLSKAESAVQQGDVQSARKYLDQAQADVEALEHFLGR